MQLYLLVWEFKDLDMECEWTHFVSDEESISQQKQHEIIRHFMRENRELKPTEYRLENVWCNRVDDVDGYSIILKSY